MMKKVIKKKQEVKPKKIRRSWASAFRLMMKVLNIRIWSQEKNKILKMMMKKEVVLN